MESRQTCPPSVPWLRLSTKKTHTAHSNKFERTFFLPKNPKYPTACMPPAFLLWSMRALCGMTYQALCHQKCRSMVYISFGHLELCHRPYQLDSTASRPLSEVKQVRVRLVVRFVRTCEVRVLMFSFCPFHLSIFSSPYNIWCNPHNPPTPPLLTSDVNVGLLFF